MQPIQINVQVNIGVTDSLSKLVMMFADSAASKVLPEEHAPISFEQESETIEHGDPSTEPAVPVITIPEKAEESAPAEPQPAAVTEAVAKEYTEEDVRAAMDRTRKRIEGENYKEKPDSEAYKKWHRQVTAWFKNTASLFGAVKPSALPDSDSRRRFIEECDTVEIKDNELTKPLPF